MRVVIALIVVIGGLVWLWEPFESFRDEITSYPAYCSNGLKILPIGLAFEPNGSAADVSKKMREAASNCEIITANRTTYRTNSARGEVYYKNIDFDVGVYKLINCAILSRTDWKCEYPDGSGKVEFNGGLEAIKKEDAAATPAFFYMRRWQWWTARLVSLVGYNSGLHTGPVRSSWLIPEQKLGF